MVILPTIDGFLQEDFIFNIPNQLGTSVVSATTAPQNNILSNGATTFASNWPTVALTNGAEVQQLHPYAKGIAAVWRPEGSYVYNTSAGARSSSTQVDLSEDGTYGTYQFDWQTPVPETLPNWLKANTITGYNSESQEVENEDVLGVYTSSIYGYGGNLPVAAGNNMANREMGFTGFEDLGVVSGNLIFGAGSVNVPTTLPILSGKSNILVIDEPVDIVENLFAQGDQVTVLTSKHAVETTILCIGEDGNATTANPFPGKTIVVLEERINGSDEVFFKGTLLKEELITRTNAGVIADWAHSGTRSLRIAGSNPKRFKQEILNLQPNRTYSLYGWASGKSRDYFYESNKVSTNLAVRILMDGLEVGRARLDGPIIEGWQSVKGNFTVPTDGYDELEIEFLSGARGSAFFDDIRIFPLDGNMQGFVYDSQLRLSATLDENNYATYYDYDGENKLFLIRKETIKGIKTIQQTTGNQKGPR